MQRLLFYILIIFSFLYLLLLPSYTGAEYLCEPTFNRDYTVENSCQWPGNYKIYGNIYVNDKIVTVPSGWTLGINLSSNNIQFTTGKILFRGSGKIDNSISDRFYKTVSYSSDSWITNCPTGYDVLNTGPTNYLGATRISTPPSGEFYCGK